jgi:hypothetical protein
MDRESKMAVSSACGADQEKAHSGTGCSKLLEIGHPFQRQPRTRPAATSSRQQVVKHDLDFECDPIKRFLPFSRSDPVF